tara:strand:+ start:758 stop:1081 length:324 start_codon:yes stop_codon:yes gene_type:complete
VTGFEDYPDHVVLEEYLTSSPGAFKMLLREIEVEDLVPYTVWYSASFQQGFREGASEVAKYIADVGECRPAQREKFKQFCLKHYKYWVGLETEQEEDVDGKGKMPAR